LNPEECIDKLLADMSTVFLATLREDGTPDVRAISVVRSDGFKTIWMISGALDKKTRELESDPRCMIYAATLGGGCDEHAELRLWGIATVMNDPATVESVWNDVYDDFFSEGGKQDPTVRILKFTASSGEYTTQHGSGILRFEQQQAVDTVYI
jgi:general stress protein 26